jgi:hypothetical protein
MVSVDGYEYDFSSMAAQAIDSDSAADPQRVELRQRQQGLGKVHQSVVDKIVRDNPLILSVEIVSTLGRH